MCCVNVNGLEKETFIQSSEEQTSYVLYVYNEKLFYRLVTVTNMFLGVFQCCG